MARFLGIKFINQKLKQKETAKELGCSSSALQRYRFDIKMQSLYKTKNPERPRNDFKRSQMTSKNANENDEIVSKKIQTKKVFKRW